MPPHSRHAPGSLFCASNILCSIPPQGLCPSCSLESSSFPCTSGDLLMIPDHAGFGANISSPEHTHAGHSAETPAARGSRVRASPVPCPAPFPRSGHTPGPCLRLCLQAGGKRRPVLQAVTQELLGLARPAGAQRWGNASQLEGAPRFPPRVPPASHMRPCPRGRSQPRY